MENIDKIFYINLSFRRDRNEHILEQFKKENLPLDKIERYEAIDGLTYKFNDEELKMFKNVEFLKYLITPSDTIKKIIGNQLSHYYILQTMFERDYDNIIILQDDVILKDKFSYYLNKIMVDLPDDAEIINFGLHELANYEDFIPYDLYNDNKNANLLEKQITEFVYLYKTFNPDTYIRINPTSLGFIVTKKGCKNLLNYFNNTGFNYATDWNYNLYLQNKNIFYGSKYILATGNSKFKSDIFFDTDNLKMEQLVDTRFFFTDKNTVHSYFEVYEKILSPYRKIFKNILEIGIGDFNEKNGGSIILWSLYFKNATINAIDIVNNSRVYDILKNKNNINLYLEKNAYDENFVKNQFNDVLFDLVLDDGPHTFESNCKCIELYSSLLSEKGILIIEDVQNIEWIKKFIDITPNHLKKFIHVYDLRHIKNRYDDILFVINKNEINNNHNSYITNLMSEEINDTNIPLVISYENNFKDNKNSKLFKQTLNNNNWKYIFIGEGKKWYGFIDRINGYSSYLKTLPSEKIVILSDARDVFCLREPTTFIDHLNNVTNIDKKIIISSEIFLVCEMDWNDEQINEAIKKQPDFFWQGIHMKKFWNYHNKLDNLPLRKYLNAGLIVGKVKNLINSFEWILNNNFSDDQLAFSTFTNENPELVHLDYEAEITHTSGFGVNGGFYDVKQKNDSPTLSELCGMSCYFLHLPGLTCIKGQNYIYEIICKIYNLKIIEQPHPMANLYNIKINDKINYQYFMKNNS